MDINNRERQVCHREALCPTLHAHTCKPPVTAGMRRVGTVLLLCCSHHQKWTNVGSQSQRPSTMAIDFIWVWLAGEGERWDLNPRPLEPQSKSGGDENTLEIRAYHLFCLGKVSCWLSPEYPLIPRISPSESQQFSQHPVTGHFGLAPDFTDREGVVGIIVVQDDV